MKEKQYWIVTSNKGNIYTNEKGEIFLGGSPSLVFIPLFKIKSKAMTFRKKVNRYFKTKSKVLAKLKPDRFYVERMKIQ